MTRRHTYSCIIPNYNDSASIGGALDAIRAQTVPFDEVLIIDDGSTDGSVEVIKRLIADMPAARLLQNEKNMGVVATLNHGIAQIRGDYFLMASSNDRYSPHMVERCGEVLSRWPEAAIICGNGVFREVETGRERPVFIPLPQVMSCLGPAEVKVQLKRAPLTFFGGGLMMKREAVLAVHSQVEALRWHADWMLYYMLSLRHGMCFVPEPFVTIAIEDGSYSAAARQWSRQGPVIKAMLYALLEQFPDQWDTFRRSAILPTYQVRALPLLMGDPRLRGYITPLLLWRIAAYRMAFWLKRLLPRDLLMRLRPLFRV